MPEAAAFVPVTAEDAIADVLTSVTGYVPGPRTRSVPVRSVTRPSAYLRISDGCDRRCSYCTIPSIRGPHRSLTLPRIVAEARELVAHGALEIVLIGQDTTAWGRDLAGDETLADVVAALADLKGLRWLRIMYAQPDGITDELLDVIGSSDVVCNYLDMPLQHVDARILRAMRRGGGVDGYRGLIERIRAAVPDIVLRTTLISGFPGETSDQARELLRFVEDMGFDYVGVFPYSPEDGTQAATFESQVPLRTRRARAQRLRDAGDRVGAEKAASHVGRVVDVLVEAVDEEDGVVIGRWRGQAPDIDGVVVLDRGQPGSVVSARITDSFGYDLEGQVL
jgi:ribosomal protein S12 methylthiotransferase